jgi:hypothetical protein
VNKKNVSMKKMATPPPPATIKIDDSTLYGGLMLTGLIITAVGYYNRESHLRNDSLRSVKVTVPITKITKYNVTYKATRFNTRPQYVMNVAPENIISAGALYSFYEINSKNTFPISLPIGEVDKTVSEFQVMIDNVPVIIDDKNFTRRIEASDVGKDIDLEYEPGKMTTNISMVTDGMTSSQYWDSWGLLIAGLILILIVLLKIFNII